MSDRVARPTWTFPLLAAVALGTAAGIVAAVVGRDEVASWLWGVVTATVLARVGYSSASKLLEGRVAVDLVAVLALLGSLVFGELLAGAVIALMVVTGEALEDYAQRRAHRDLSSLVSMAPSVAHRVTDQGLETIAAAEVQVGDLLLVRPGEVLPVDGVVVDDVAVLDESILTGEPMPVEHQPGDRVASGAVNAGGGAHVRATATADDSSYAGIVRLVGSAGVGRSSLVRLADRYALVFIPVTLAVAGGAWVWSGDQVRALAVLVVATPCPLVLAAPVALVSGISRGARSGVIVKDGAALEALGGASTVLFDKTGTLTAGHPRVTGIAAAPGTDPSLALELAASLEQASPHVMASALVAEAHLRGLDLRRPGRVVEAPGTGVRGVVDGHDVVVGSAVQVLGDGRPGWVRDARRRAEREGCSVVYVAIDQSPVLAVLLTDEIRGDTPRALRALRRCGVERLVMVTGDRLDVAEPIARALGLDEVYADRSPEEKVEVVQAETERSGVTAMVGDGVNDAPALAVADLGVAMGARGATVSSEAADVVLVVDRLDGLAEGVRVAQRSQVIARQSVVFGMGLSFVAMGFAAGGLLVPVAGALVQELIDVAAISNALRALVRPRGERRPAPVPERWELHLRGDHTRLWPLLDDLRSVADGLERADELDVQRLTLLTRRVRDEIVAHERADEDEIYPDIAEHLGGDDPLAAMSRTHREIFHLASLLDRLVDTLDGDLAEADRSEARRILYALDAILRLHFSQEEELLLSLGAEPATDHRG